MAQNLVVNFIGNNKLSKTTAAISADLKKFQKTTQDVGKTLNSVLGGAGIILGFQQLKNVLKQSTKAAVEDVKSQALLANALRNTTGASAFAIAGAEAFIAKTQLQTSVLDDQLRPALATAVRATGSLAKGQDLLTLALDVSAGSEKGLDVTTKALSKAYGGNYTALNKLLPGIKLGADYQAVLGKQFENSAMIAANNDPYKTLAVIFADIQETIGLSLIPALQDMAKYLKSEEGQRSVKQIAGLFIQAGQAVANITRFLIQNITVIKAVVASLVFVRVAWGLITLAVKIYDITTKLAVVTTKALKYALASTGIGAVVVLVATLGAAWLEAKDSAQAYVDTTTDTGTLSFINGGVRRAQIFAKLNRDQQNSLTGLREALADPRLILEMRDAIKKNIGKYIQVDFLSNIITANGVEIYNKPAIEDAVKSVADAIKSALDAKISGIKSTAEKFRDAFGLAFGVFGKDEQSVFSVEVVIGKLKRILAASKGFADNIKKLRDAGADQSVISQLIALGPASGNIAAKGLLASPSGLKQYLGLNSQLYATGAQVGAQQAVTGDATYEINLNGTSVKASDIIREIRLLEKKTGRKYLLGN